MNHQYQKADLTLRMLLIFIACALIISFSTKAWGEDIWLIELKGAIGPANADFVIRSLKDAATDGAALVVIRIDTPGGLDLAMRDIISSILASAVPVASWVAPNGARAASAGTYILYASHFAAMSPATNVGSSTPVNLGGGSSPLPNPLNPSEESSDPEQGPQAATAMERKVINDAVAYIKGLAQLRERNVEWAEQTVREAANLTASEALELNVIDIIADSIEDLLQQLQGRQITVDNRQVILNVGTANVVLIEPDWRHQFLALITNPNVAYILLMIGIYGLILEFYNPGLGLPGIVGIICLLIGAYSLQMLPINYVGLALILVGIALMITEALSPSFGIFGLGGIAAFILGSVILMDTELEAYRISLPIIAAFAVASTGIFIYAMTAVIRMHRHAAVTGTEAIVGATGVAVEDFDKHGHIRAFSEIWSADSEQSIRQGEVVEITEVDGLTLKVKKQEH